MSSHAGAETPNLGPLEEQQQGFLTFLTSAGQVLYRSDLQSVLITALAIFLSSNYRLLFRRQECKRYPNKRVMLKKKNLVTSWETNSSSSQVPMVPGLRWPKGTTAYLSPVPEWPLQQPGHCRPVAFEGPRRDAHARARLPRWREDGERGRVRPTRSLPMRQRAVARDAPSPIAVLGSPLRDGSRGGCGARPALLPRLLLFLLLLRAPVRPSRSAHGKRPPPRAAARPPAKALPRGRAAALRGRRVGVSGRGASAGAPGPGTGRLRV